MGDSRLLKLIHRKWTSSVKGLDDVPYHDRLLNLNLFSFQGRLLRAEFILTHKIFYDLCTVVPGDVFRVVKDTRTHGHRFKVATPLANLEVRKRIFSVRMLRW